MHPPAPNRLRGHAPRRCQAKPAWVAGVLNGEQSSTTKDRDFGQSDLVGRSPKVGSASVLAVPVLTDFASARETARSTPAT
jgi:hypothetical protein